MDKKNFVKTSDEQTAETLKKEGFTLISKDNGMFCFMNDATFKFSEVPKNVVYTNVLCM